MAGQTKKRHCVFDSFMAPVLQLETRAEHEIQKSPGQSGLKLATGADTLSQIHSALHKISRPLGGELRC